ncbi:serine protease [Lentzea sp. NBRC 105346]|uniref:S8 family serine peptidase n=1 Tax=Lentzea sp. NBRC 105346 TaxID=3032205 RepID=UPI0024A091E2|nr:S8 family serine peptidase [Lentzea sp. NBRC 105346]GLZ32389.1 serine protease [Lentzea sp. NBRC 105346]
MHSRRIASALVACVLACGTAVASPAAAAPAEPQDSITLITGDKVLVDPSGRMLGVRPGAGREHITFSRSQVGGHTLVVPQDAMSLLAGDKVDRRLFDITALREFGYTKGQLPLVVGGHGVMSARSADSLRALTSGGQKVWLDGIRQPTLDRSVKQIGAPAAHQAGITGKGVKVAVLDTGVDEKHPDLAGKQLAEKNFTEDPDNTDKVGHGTHVGATIASGDATYGGVAPGAQLLDGKVCVEFGCRESWILDGMRWAAESGAAVVNLSLGGGDTEEIDPLEEAVNTLSAKYGTLFVIAAGNSGPSTESVGSPGSAEAALTVGAVERDDSIASFSSRGPRIGDGGIKPDVTAPGVGIVAAKAGTNGEHIAYSGTSMATPHVAGAAALLKQQHPDWSGAQLKALLTSTAKPTPGLGAFDQGAGRIDVAKAIKQDVVSLPSNISFGLQQWPHNDDKPVTREVTYLNPTDAALEFDLKLDGGAPLFSLSANKVTVPARGKASVTLTTDTRLGTTDGAYTGQLTATAGTRVVRTPFSVTREVESYDVTLEALDRDGKPSSSNFFNIVGLDVSKWLFTSAVDGKAKLRLPKGSYIAYGFVLSGGGFDMLVGPTLNVTGAALATFDASKAKPIEITAPEPTGDFTIGELSFQRNYGERPMNFGLISFGGFANTRSLYTGPDVPPAEFSSLVSLQTNSASDDATFYRLSWEVPGKFPTGFSAAPRKEELARTETKFGSVFPGATYQKAVLPSGTYGGGGGSAVYPVPEGKKAVDYVTTGVAWEQMAFHPLGMASTQPKRYQAGQTYHENLLFAVFSPSLPTTRFPYVSREGDDLYAGIPLFGDYNGGYGSSAVESGSTSLYRDGVLIGTSDRPGGGRFQKLPATSGTYRLETSAVRSAQFELSTSVSAAWTFKSARGTSAVPTAVVRFLPKLDETNTIQAGRLHRVGFAVQQQGGGTFRVTDVEYSFDDGKSWRRAGVIGSGALIYHSPGYISLRAKATDQNGNSTEVTVIRAYRSA